MSNELALLAACALVGGWLALFFLGLTAGGWIHLMPAAAGLLVARILRPSNFQSRKETP